MQKIGVFGGTFDPVHKGHVRLAQLFIKELSLDRLLVIPAKIPPHKLGKEITPAEKRLEMCHLAFDPVPGAEVSTIELDSPEVSFTSITVQRLKGQYPDSQLYLIMGSDMLLYFEKWHDYESLLQNTILCCTRRTGEVGEQAEMDAMVERLRQKGGRFCLLDEEPIVISSTQVKEMLLEDADVSSYLEPDILAYITENNLYAPKDSRFMGYLSLIKGKLKPKRYVHSICVSQAAAALAKRYGAPVEKARVAGILHDVMKNTPDEALLQMIEGSGIILSCAERCSPKVWHSIAGMLYVRDELGVEDVSILGAIRYHTTAKADMSLLEKIIFVADSISAERVYPDVDFFRAMAAEDLDETVWQYLVYTVCHLAKKGRPLSEDTLRCYNFYACKRMEENSGRK